MEMIDEPPSDEALENYKKDWLKKFRNMIPRHSDCVYGVLPWESLYGAAMDDEKQWPPVWKPLKECPEYYLLEKYDKYRGQKLKLFIKHIRETRGYDWTTRDPLGSLIPFNYSLLKSEDSPWQHYTLKCKAVLQKINKRAKDYKKQYVLNNIENIVKVLGTSCDLLTFRVREVPYPDDPNTVPSDVQKTVQAFVYAAEPKLIFVKEWRFKPEEQVADMINKSEQKHADESTAPLVQRRRELAVMVRNEGSFKRFCRVGAVDDVTAMDEEQSAEESVKELKCALACYSSGAGYKRLNAFRKLRKLLSKSENSQVEGALKAGALRLLSRCLICGTPDEEMLEAIRCLTNIAAGNLDETKAVLPELGLLILKMDVNDTLHILEQCAWVLGNVAGEGEELRDVVLSLGSIVPLARMMVLNEDSTGKMAAWALSNLIMGPDAKAATELIELDGVLGAILRHLKAGDEELATEVAWMVVYITALSDIGTCMLASSDLPQILVDRLVSSNSLRLLIPVLRGLGNLVAGDYPYATYNVPVPGKEITEIVIQELCKFLQSEHGVLVKESAWLLSNIAAVSVEHKKLIHSSEAVSILISLLLSSNASFDLRKEVAFALANLCTSPGKGTLIREHLVSLVNGGCIGGFYSLVRSEDVDADAAMLCLQFFELALMGRMPDRCSEIEDGMKAVFHFLEEKGLRIRKLTYRRLGHAAARCDTLNSLQLLWLSLADR